MQDCDSQTLWLFTIIVSAEFHILPPVKLTLFLHFTHKPILDLLIDLARPQLPIPVSTSPISVLTVSSSLCPLPLCQTVCQEFSWLLPSDSGVWSFFGRGAGLVLALGLSFWTLLLCLPRLTLHAFGHKPRSKRQLWSFLLCLFGYLNLNYFICQPVLHSGALSLPKPEPKPANALLSHTKTGSFGLFRNSLSSCFKVSFLLT